MKSNTNHTPIEQSERIALIDIFRGLAIFGILMVNLPMMYHGISSMLLDTQYSDATTLQTISKSFINFFFEGKFYIIFSLLFGYGFWMFINKKTESEKSIIPIFRRRLFILLLFGIGHVVFLWAGDVLIYYAIFGFMLISTRNYSDRKMLKGAIICLSIIVALNLLMVIPNYNTIAKSEMELDFAEMERKTNSILAIYSTGSYIEILIARLKEYQIVFAGAFASGLIYMAMFLIGAVIAKKQYIKNFKEKLPQIHKIFWATLIVGIIANTIFAILKLSVSYSTPSWGLFTMSITSIIGGIAFAFCYCSAIIQLYDKRKDYKIFGLLAATGRMALTNYLCQSVIVAFLIYPFGFGLFNKIEFWQSIIITISIFTIQMFISRWWLTKFHFGPFEWLWRCLTYMKIQPLVRK